MNILNFINQYHNIDDIKKNLLDNNLDFKHYHNEDLLLIKYDKKKSNMNDKKVKECRGIIINLSNKKIVCIPPKKSDDIDNYINELNDNWDKIRIEEFIDGTMINLFYFNNKWTISTRSCLYADCNWNNQRLFSELFNEVLIHSNINFDNLNKNYSYSLVLKHPENRIIKKYDKPDLVLVQVNDLSTTELIDLYSIDTVFNLPKSYNFNNIDEIKTYIDNSNYNLQGIVIKYKNLRFKIRNEKYNNIKLLKGNSYSDEHRFLELKKNNKIEDFLLYFDEFNDKYEFYNNIIINIINFLYTTYINRFIKKQESPYPKEYGYHLYNIHKLYLEKNNMNNDESKIIRIVKQDVYNYINSLTVNNLYPLLILERNKLYI